jgi:hypothetical protein
MKTYLRAFMWLYLLMCMCAQLQAQAQTWDHQYSFPTGYKACFTKVIQSENQELLLAGYAEFGWFESSPGFMKVDTNGFEVWSRSYDFPFITHTLVQTSAGNYFSFCFNPLFPIPIKSDIRPLREELENEARLLKLNDMGDTLFSVYTQEIGWVSDMIVDDGKLVTVGSTNYYDELEYDWRSKTTLLVLDTTGIILLRKEYLSDLDSRANSIVKANNGNYLITGATSDSYWEPGFIEPDKMYLLEVDAGGNILWEYFSDIEYSEGKEVEVCDDGNYALIGDGLNTEEDNDIILWKFDTQNNLTLTSFSKLPKTDKAFGFQQTIDGGFIICGYIISDVIPNWVSTFLVLKTDANGNEEWHKQNLSYNNCAYDLILNNHVGFYIAGQGYTKARLVKTDTNGDGMIVTSIDEKMASEEPAFVLYPNPGNNFINIENPFSGSKFRFSMFNVFGSKVFETTISDDLTPVNTSNIPKGLYFYNIGNPLDIIQSGKWMKD